MCVFRGLNFMDFEGKRFDQTKESELFAKLSPSNLNGHCLFFRLPPEANACPVRYGA